MFQAKQILLSIFALNGKYAFLEDLTTVYRIRKGSLSHTDSIKHKIDFAIRYSIQKMDVAEYFNLAATVKYKLVIKFVFQYLYIYQDGFSSEFIEILNKYSNEKRSVCLKRAITTILLLSKSKVLRDLFLIILNFKNR